MGFWKCAAASVLVFLSSAVAQAQPATPPQELSSAPGRSGGEGGTSGPVTVTVRPATKDNPILGSIVGQPRAAPSGKDPVSRCLALPYGDFSTIPGAPTQLIDATVRPAAGGVPAVCVINGYTAPQVGFRIWLPLETWNGKYMQGGCGGRCGDLLPTLCETQFKRGYACLANNLGHRGTTYDNIWAIGDVDAEMDMGFRATHVATKVGKHLTRHFYGKAPKFAYFVGASQGGRQGLVTVQRFPLDFDGVVAGVATVPLPGLSKHDAPPQDQTGGRLLYAGGKAALSPDDIRLLHAAVMARCDAEDGLKDRIIGDPRACPFRTAELQCAGAKTSRCLTAAQIAVVDRVYETGPKMGSELSWLGAYVAQDGSPGRYIARNANTDAYPYAWIFYDQSNPDIRPFKAAGGKFIMYAGWADEVVNPAGSVGYYETVERVMGGRAQTQDFFRLFMVPGQAHIPGNVGAESLDYLLALEDWVERGVAPDRLVGRKLKSITQMLGPVVLDVDMRPDNYLYSRPIFPYPLQARYSGAGDPDLETSFRAWDPATGAFVN